MSKYIVLEHGMGEDVFYGPFDNKDDAQDFGTTSCDENKIEIHRLRTRTKVAMDTYLPTDQPETCPECGVRAILESQQDNYQTYSCPNHKCSYFWWEVDLEEELAGKNEIE